MRDGEACWPEVPRPTVTLHVEPVRLEHAERIQQLVNHPEILATTSMPEPYPPDGAHRFLEHVLLRREAGAEWAYAMVADGEGLVGLVGVTRLAGEGRKAEMGYWVGRGFWGRGYATEAVAQVARLAFRELGLDQLIAHALAENTGSRRVLERNGFAFLGFGGHHVPKWGPGRLVARYGLRREEWERVAGPGNLGGSP